MSEHFMEIKKEMTFIDNHKVQKDLKKNKKCVPT